jgi:hypothetical protein
VKNSLVRLALVATVAVAAFAVPQSAEAGLFKKHCAAKGSLRASCEPACEPEPVCEPVCAPEPVCEPAPVCAPGLRTSTGLPATTGSCHVLRWTLAPAAPMK